jgi:DNA-binding transcriptional LysR family regulator
MTKELFNTVKHIDLHIAGGRPGVARQGFSRAMKQHGLNRDIGLAVPHFSAAAMAAARSDLVATLPRRSAETFVGMMALRIVELPFSAGPLITSLIWHTRTHADPGSRYFRELVIEALRVPELAKAAGDTAPRARARRG